MTRFSTTRRTLLKATAVALVASGLVACSKSEATFQGSDITGSNLGKDLAMVDHTGQPRTLADYKGKVLVVFFGFTQCPDVCPTAMAQMAQAVELLGEDADKVQVALVSVDPERDTPEVLNAYVKAFNKDFVGLTGTPDQLARTAKSFKAYYSKVAGPTPEDYTMEHGSSFYVLDQEGNARVLIRGDATAEAIAEDIRQLV